MNKPLILLLVPAILLLAVVASSNNMIPLAHAATGEVCLADPSTATGSATPCPSPAPVFAGPIGQQIRVGVFVQGSDALNGFDITLVADHTVLAPLSVDLTGTTVPGATTIVLECIQGILKAGSVCAPTDNIDTLHLVLTAGLGLITTPPTTGLFFTAVYNITGTTVSGGTSLGFQTGCGTSTSVVGGVCITVANGSNTPDTETAQGSAFDNSAAASMPFVAVTATPTSFGPEFPGTANTATVTATAMNGFGTGFAADSVDFTTATTSGLTATLSGTNPCATGGVSCSVSLSLSATAAGNYVAVVSGTYATTDALGNPDTLSGVVTIHVVIDDFGFTVSPTSISFSSGSTGTATVTLSSLNGFAGPISLATGTVLPATPPLTITYSPSSVTLTASGTGSTQTSTATFSATVTAATTYHATIRATSGARVKTSATLTVVVGPAAADFSIAANPTAVSVNTGVAGTSTITVGALNGFTGVVSLSAGSTACSLSPTTVTGSGTSTLSCTFATAGTVAVTVTGTSGTLTHSATVTFTVSVPADFSISASPTAVTVVTGSPGTSTITISPLNSFTGNVALTSDNSACTLTPATVTGGTGTSTLSCSFTSAGPVTVTVTGTSGSLSHSAPVAYTVNNPPDFTIVASPNTVSVTVNSAGTSTITISPLNGFAGSVALTSDNTACTLTPATVTGGSGTSTLSCTFTSTGTVTVTVTGTSGSLSHTATVAYTVTGVPDFSVSASPTTVTVVVNSPGVSTITVSPVNGFTGSVALTANNAACTLTPATVSGGSGTSTLSCTFTSTGAITVSVTGTSGSLSHSATVAYTVTAAPDFSISASPTSVTVAVNSAGTSTITVSPLNGFTGTVALVSDNSACTLTPASLTGGSGTSILSCTFTATGSVTVTVTGTSGSLTHSATVAFLARQRIHQQCGAEL